MYTEREPDQHITTSHHRHRRHREDGLHAPLRRNHNNRALDGRIDSERHSHFQLYVEQLVIVVDRIPVCARDHFLDGRSRRFANRQHMPPLLVAAIDVVAGLHSPQSPVGGISATSTLQEITCIPDDSHIYSGPLAAAVVVVRAVVAALAPFASVLLPAASSAVLIVESAREGAFAAPWLSKNT
jgi:hypothetical protein